MKVKVSVIVNRILKHFHTWPEPDCIVEIKIAYIKMKQKSKYSWQIAYKKNNFRFDNPHVDSIANQCKAECY